MRLQLALNVGDLDEAIDYYTRLLGVPVNKRESGYANLILDEPALKLVLLEAPDAAERLNHLGFEVFTDDDVRAAGERLHSAGLETRREDGVCCFARQNKVISHDPQDLMWEWYRVVEDSPTFFAELEESTEACSSGQCP